MQSKHVRVGTPVVVGLAMAILLMLATGASGGLAQVALALPQSVPTTGIWSSGWQSINRGQTITFDHDLGLSPEQLGVELWFWDTNGGSGINRANYGGLEYNGTWHGAYWHHLTANTVQVTRLTNDNMADRILIRVWEATSPDYDSGWQTVITGSNVFTHNLGITNTELTVSMWFSDATHGIHHFSYGGLTDGTDEVGAYWLRLTDDSLQVYRRVNDANVEQVRVVVTEADPPDYDSLVALGGWQDVAAGSAVTFTHSLNWSPSLLVVRTECYDTASGGAGIHQMWGGGDSWSGGLRGAHIQNLTANTVRLVRRANDVECDRVRVRIWKRGYRVFLPLVVSNYVQETELAYDDGTAESWQSHDKDSGFAVMFTTPGTSARLVKARYYLNSVAGGNPIEVHVWDASHADLITPFTVTPSAGESWLDVDLSGSNLTVSGDFYLGFLYPGATYDPPLGVDTSSADGRSYEVPWQTFGSDYMIRAVLVSQ